MAGKFKTMTLIEESELSRLRDKEIADYNPTVRSMSTIQNSINKVFDDPNIPDEDKIKLINTFQEKFAQLYTKFKDSSNALPNAILAAATAMKPKVPPKLVGVNPEEQVQRDMDEEIFHEAEGDISPALNDPETVPPVPVASQTIAFLPPTPAFSTTTARPTSLTVKEIGLPSQYERKLGEFSEFLNKHQNHIHGNSKDELVLDGKIIPNTSFSNLVHSMYIRNQNLNLNGFPDFISKLASLNTNPTIFSNGISISALNAHSKTKESIQTRNSNTNLKGKGLKRKTYPISSFLIPPGKKPRILHMFRL